MSKLMGFGVCCMGISVWGAFQLTIMGILYKIEALNLLEDAEEEEFEDVVDFIKRTEENYGYLAINCWVCAVLYMMTIGLSYYCIKRSQKQEKLKKAREADDDLMCVPPEFEEVERTSTASSVTTGEEA